MHIRLMIQVIFDEPRRDVSILELPLQKVQEKKRTISLVHCRGQSFPYRHPSVHALVAESQHLEPVSDSPQTGEEREGKLRDPDRRTERARQRDGGAQRENVGVPLLVFHHAKVLAKREVAHGVEGKPAHQLVYDNRIGAVGSDQAL